MLQILCFAAIPQAGALLTDTRQPPTSASSKGSNAAADAGMPNCHAVSQGTMYHKHVHLYIPKLHPSSAASAACHIACHCIGVHAFCVLMTASNLHGQRYIA